MRKRMQPAFDLLEAVAGACQEAIDGDWEVNDEDFEAMKHDLEKAARLLKMPPFDYRSPTADECE